MEISLRSDAVMREKFFWSHTYRISCNTKRKFRYNFSLHPVNGEPLTESIMKKYLLLLKLCGVYTFAPPRIVTEGFAGNQRGDGSLPYGKFLMEKMLRQEFSK